MMGGRLVAVLCFAALAAGCSGAGALDRLSRGETGQVMQIRQGDDFVLNSGLEVRLAGVEAPHNNEPGAAEAKAALTSLVQGQQVTLFYGGAHRDHYGRAIAQVRMARHGVWLEEALLKAGRVRVHTWPDNMALVHPMLTAEARARTANTGLWALPAYRVLLPSEADRAGRFTVMEGRVAKVTATAGPEWLDFAEGGAAARIPAQAETAFQQAGIDLPKLTGHVVRVRGWVSNGVLSLDHPAALEQISN